MMLAIDMVIQRTTNRDSYTAYRMMTHGHFTYPIANFSSCDLSL